MALDVFPEYLVKRLGHNGGKCIPGIGYRGFHMQEFIRVVTVLELATVTPIEFCPVNRYADKQTMMAVDMAEWSRFMQYQIGEGQGVITGLGLKSKVGHAVAFSQGNIYDPDGGEPYPFTFDLPNSHNFVPQTAWVVRQWKT
jgi:hypothetical protein